MEALAGEYIRNYLRVKRFPRISLVCKLVLVQYREYEYGLLSSMRRIICKLQGENEEAKKLKQNEEYSL